MAWVPFAAPSAGAFAETNRQGVGVGWVERSETHQYYRVMRWVSLRALTSRYRSRSLFQTRFYLLHPCSRTHPTPGKRKYLAFGGEPPIQASVAAATP